MALEYDRELRQLWAACDNTCNGRMAVVTVSAQGHFTVNRFVARPSGLPDVNNEGFAFAPLAECSNGTRPAFWADDANTSGHAIRQGTLTCSAF